MARTGEKYTDARRALVDAGGRNGGAGEGPGGVITWPADSLGWFTDQAYNAILLAADEARMLSHPRVEPEHLLLAAARYGNVERLLAGEGVPARAIHDVITAVRGFGVKLELWPRRSPASEQVLRRAVTAAAARGVLGPSTEHLLIALGNEELPARILAETGISDTQALVDAHFPIDRPPLDHALIERRAAQLASIGSAAPSPGPIPPMFERFTAQARAAINAGIEYADRTDDPYVELRDLLYGVTTAKVGVAAAVRATYGWHVPAAQSARPGYPRAAGLYRSDPEHQNVFTYALPHDRRTTGIFSADARRIVAEDVLLIAERLGHRALTTGHVLLAIVERAGEHISEIISSLPDTRELTAAITDALPGEEVT
ncbi:MAG: Clp protease N-terminal domain-containing protein [Streptosporangiaceae bacterium]